MPLLLFTALLLADSQVVFGRIGGLLWRSSGKTCGWLRSMAVPLAL
jgi:hypothetical protein